MSLSERRVIFPLLIFFVFLAGCNIYEWTTSNDTTRDVIEDGRVKMRDGDYQGAFELFDEALDDDPYNSELRYLHAKAALKRSGVSSITLATEITSLKTYEIHSDLPFMNRTVWPDNRADTLYKNIFIVLRDMRLIASGATYGLIDTADVKLDLTLGSTINALLRIRDTNGDSTIASPPDINLALFFGRDTLQDDGFGGMSGDDLNNLLDQLDTLMDEGINNILDVLGEDNGINEDSLKNVLDKLKEGKELYRVNDGIDNDGDWVQALHDLDGNGVPSADWDGPFADANGDGNPLYDPEPQVDEEELDNVDNDGDGLIDEDGQNPYWEH
jgi:hypothetical protein